MNIEERRRWIEREIRKANQRIVHNAKELREVMDRVLELSQEHANLLLVSALWQSYGEANEDWLSVCLPLL